jgi:hypothetical protein
MLSRSDQLRPTTPPVDEGSARSCMFSKGSIPSPKLWHALHAVDKYLRRQAAWLVNYANGTVPVNGSERRSPRAQRTSWSTGGRPNRGRCDGRDGALICGSKSAAQSTMARSVPGSDIDLNRIADADLTLAKAA